MEQMADSRMWESPAPGSYAREVLVDGLRLGRELGVNPFAFGLVGATDTHFATPGLVDEDRFVGHAAGTVSARLEVPALPDRLDFNPGGLAVLWAEENSRDALFEAMRRREAYGTSGPRMEVRFFGGWGYPEALCAASDLIAQGYAGGVPMGGDLPDAPADAGAPRFVVTGLADPGTIDRGGTPLQRLQIIKGWLEDGEPREAVFDVAGDPANGASVDPLTCNPIGPGARQLCAVWQDPGFDPGTPAVYYARVVENPSCRWKRLRLPRSRCRLPEPGQRAGGARGVLRPRGSDHDPGARVDLAHLVHAAGGDAVSEATPEYDPFSYELDRDPYPTYRWMRDEAPAYYNERLDFWAFTRFDDNHRAFVDPATYSSSHGTSVEFMDTPKPDTGLMIWMDPPRHTRYRKLVSKAFTPARIGDLEPMIRRIACDYLDALVGRERFDVVKDFTARLPMDVISTMLGIPEADRLMVQERSNRFLHREPGNPLPTQDAIDSQRELMGYVSELIADRRRHPKQDLMSRLVEVELEEDGERERLSDDDIRSFFMLLATAGNETVTKLLATAFHALWEYPEQRRVLLAEPERIPNAVEETLRFDPPSQYQGRVTTREVALHGRTIPAGAKVLLINGASGRDERKFPEPDRFDVRREIDFHLGFGYGRHVCLGAFLARMESRIAIEEFLRRFPDYDIPPNGTERMHSSNVRGLSSLTIHPTP